MRISDTEVEVQGCYYERNVNFSEDTYTVRKQKRKWIVAPDVMRIYPTRSAADGSIRAARRAGM